MSEIRDAESSSKEGRDSMSFAQLMELRERESTPTDPSRWSISYEQLLEIDNLVRKKSRFRGVPSAMTMRDVNETIIVPRCRATKTSYAASLNPKGLEMDSFVSHCWDEPFCEFVQSIREAFQFFPRKPNLWICAFALRQGDPEDISQQIGQEALEDAPFVKALQEAKLFVVVRNRRKDLYSRIWCICELIYAVEEGFTHEANKTLVIGPDQFRNLKTSCLQAEAHDPEDKERILRLLREKHNPEEIDELVWLYRMHGCDETKDESDNHLKHSWSRIATLLTRLFVMILSNILWFASEGIQTLLSRIKTSPHMTFVYTAGMDTRKTLAEVDAWKSMAWEKIQKYNEASQFELDFGKGNIHEAMRRLERAKPDNNKEAEAYASKWAKALNPKNVNQQGLVEANQLDADRKVCLEFLYRLYNCCCVPETKELDPAKVTSVVQEFDRGRRIVDMLYLLLVFDRAKSIHFNKDHQTGTRGMHWYAKKHQNRPEWKASNPSGATINKRLVWFVDDHLKIASKHGPNGWLWELMEPAEREADENDS